MSSRSKWDFSYHYKPGYIYFFVDENEGIMYFKSEEERNSFVKDEVIPSYIDCDEWMEEVTNIIAGVVTHQVQEGEKDYPVGEIDEDGCDEEGEYWGDIGYKVDYELKEIGD